VGGVAGLAAGEGLAFGGRGDDGYRFGRSGVDLGADGLLQQPLSLVQVTGREDILGLPDERNLHVRGVFGPQCGIDLGSDRGAATRTVDHQREGLPDRGVGPWGRAPRPGELA